jgi:predicted GIY-YIG superfamily endonuclease
MTTTSVYILRLEGGYYYVGKSDNPMKRYQEHVSGAGSAWTRAHKPVGVEKIIENVSPFEEDRYTKEYMAKYGIDKVRGGSYVEKRLDEDQVYSLQKEIRMAADKCTVCGRAGHFAASCYAKTDVDGNELEDEEEEVWVCEICDKEFDSEKACAAHERTHKQRQQTCYRCGRPGHYSPDCYASRHVKGYSLD